ncbi:MAG TPA: hypothetical protein VKB72_12425 [Steroidobacteraceae bacterium]|nr:hypothetical protein [Steroidobacteraceae bacterium]
MTSIRLWLLVGLLACAVQPGATQNAAFAPVAHSALVTVEAASAANGLRLRLRRTEGTAPLAVTELRVSLGGQNAPVTQQPDGTWLAAWPKGGGTADERLEVVVTHDGIREELSGPTPAPIDHKPAAGSGAGSGMAANHKQLAWWILNIVIVLIAVIAISRRMS